MRWDAAVVGAGVVGLATARALLERGAGRVVVLDKEPALGAHQSGRNSGVVHAGFTYAPGSLKARLSVAGAVALERYCARRGVAFRRIGKVVVARSEAEVAVLHNYLREGETNGVAGLKLLDAAALREVEPRVAGVAALHSSTSGIVDAPRLLEALAQDVAALGGEVRLRAPLLGVARGHAWKLRTPQGWLEADRVATCAGLQADRVAARFGHEPVDRIVPFRGSYWRLRPGREGLVRGLVYPVPDPAFPFVGVHVTPRTDGSVLAGPTALLALGREAYRHWLQPSARDLASMAGYGGFWRLLARADVRAQARRELAQAMSQGRALREARALLPALRDGDLLPSHSGIRAQLVGPRGELVEDLRIVAKDRVVHVLNAVSPGLTSSLPLGEDVAARVLALP
ncbi:MAG TPA: L-2-hydroxyglutarate oxidase [Candidatus Thermoplasmatota archaeon]|nr:L-2-hydroxyglutarate oxidase [Candidatus Thermoplasmatota archaeon]